MSITWIAAIIVPLGLYGFVVSSEFLYYAFIFSLPFSATAVVNVGANANASGVSAAMFFGSLCLGRYGAMKLLDASRRRFRRGLVVPDRLLLVFFCVCVASLAMPILIDGRLLIYSATLDRGTAAPLYFSLRNVTALVYLAFGCLSAGYFARRMSEPNVLRRSLRVYIASCIFLSVWGLFQWAMVTSGHRYPDYILNTSATMTAQGFRGSLTSASLTRISSAAVEPSLFAQTVLIALALLVIGGSLRASVFSRRATVACILVIVVALVLSTSTEAIAGLILIGFADTVVLFYGGKISLSRLLLIVLLAAAALMAYFAVPAVQGLVDSVLLTKASSYSALERLRSVQLAAGYFTQYPLLGVGWGAVTSHDLVVNLCANAGLLGLTGFLLYTGVLARRGLADFFRRRSEPLDVAVFVSFAVVLFMNALTGFVYVFGHIWFVFGAATAVSCAAMERRGRDAGRRMDRRRDRGGQVRAALGEV